jgi:hypothetical protein
MYYTPSIRIYTHAHAPKKNFFEHHYQIKFKKEFFEHCQRALSESTVTEHCHNMLKMILFTSL